MDKQTFEYLCKYYGIKKMLVELPDSMKANMRFPRVHTYALVEDTDTFKISSEIVGAMSSWSYPNDKGLVEIIRSLAYEQIETYVETIKKINSKEEVDVEVIYFNDYKESKRETWHGTLTDIFTRFDRANNSLRYCNGSYYKLVKESDEELRGIWYSTNNWYTNFNNYYLGGIVD